MGDTWHPNPLSLLYYNRIWSKGAGQRVTPSSDIPAAVIPSDRQRSGCVLVRAYLKPVHFTWRANRYVTSAWWPAP